MTDLDDLTALLTRWDVPYDQNATIHHHPIPHFQRTDWTPAGQYWQEDVISVIVADSGAYHYREGREVPTSDKVDGYNGFFTEYEFTPDGEFLRMGAWE